MRDYLAERQKRTVRFELSLAPSVERGRKNDIEEAEDDRVRDKRKGETQKKKWSGNERKTQRDSLSFSFSFSFSLSLSLHGRFLNRRNRELSFRKHFNCAFLAYLKYVGLSPTYRLIFQLTIRQLLITAAKENSEFPSRLAIVAHRDPGGSRRTAFVRRFALVLGR